MKILKNTEEKHKDEFYAMGHTVSKGLNEEKRRRMDK